MDVNFKIVHDKSSIDRQNKDNILMLKALVNGWEVWCNGDKWIWNHIFNNDTLVEVTATQSDIPEINDELREEFKKI